MTTSTALLHFARRRMPLEAREPVRVSEARHVRVTAYGAHLRVSGLVRLEAGTLTDLLAAHDELVLDDVEIQDLDDGTRRRSEQDSIPVRDLLAVHVTGELANGAVRNGTRAHAVAIRAGSFVIAGHLRVERGADPLESLRRRSAMIPLTDAWLEYWADGSPRSQCVGTILVNREAVDTIDLVTDDDLVDGLLSPLALPGAA
jgi:hypothetical protein